MGSLYWDQAVELTVSLWLSQRISYETVGYRVFGAPFCFSRVSLGKIDNNKLILLKIASFPASESWSGAKSEAKLRKSANYPGIFQVYPEKNR